MFAFKKIILQVENIVKMAKNHLVLSERAQLTTSCLTQYMEPTSLF